MLPPPVPCRVFSRLAPAVLAAALAAPAVSTAAEPELIADLAHLPYEEPYVDIEVLGRLGPHAFFLVVDPLHEAFLWRTDGTPAGTERVAELPLCPGYCGPTPIASAVAADRLFFVTDSNDRGDDLWTSDGTAEGTLRLGHVDWRSDSFEELTPLGDRLFFTREDPEHGRELWTSDGTPAGTRLAADVCPGECSSAPRTLVPFGDRLAFSATTPTDGREIRFYDPATGGVQTLGDLCPGECAGGFGLFADGDRLFFTGNDGGATGAEPWVTDGTPAGTHLLLDAAPGAGSTSIQQWFAVGGSAYWIRSASEGEPQIFRTDGTSAHTGPAEDVLGALRDHILLGVSHPTPGGLVFFASARAGGDLLAVLDAAQGETRVVRTGLSMRYEPFDDHHPRSEHVFFHAETVGQEVWVSDGSPGGTHPLGDLFPGAGGPDASGFTDLGPVSVFAGEHGFDQDSLWTTDRTPEGTERLPLDPRSPSWPTSFAELDGRLWFVTRRDDGEAGLWRTTPAGDDVELVASASSFGALTPVGSRLYLTGPRGFPNVQSTLGGEPLPLAGTQPARELTPGPGGFTYFATTGYGEELWRTDGTPSGTDLLIDVDPTWVDPCTGDDLCPPVHTASAIRLPDQLTPLGEELYFRAAPPKTYRPALWRTDGTVAGTEQVPDTPLGVEQLVALEDRIVFQGDFVADGLHDYQLWGYRPGRAPKLFADHGERPIGHLVAAGAVAYYLVEGDGGLELHRTEGRPGTTHLVAPLGGASRLNAVTDLATVGSRLYLALWTPALGSELWTSDGTAAGTGPVADLRPGPAGSEPTALTPVDDLLLFTANDGTTGFEPWVTDGTAAGTKRVADLAPGARSSSPSGYALVGAAVYFDADDGQRGTELWALDAAALGIGPPGEVPADAREILAPEYPDFRFWVRITAGGPGGSIQPARREPVCIPETVCVSGAVPGRSELFLRIVGPKPNGHLWPTLVRFSTSRIDVWIEQTATGVLRHYVLGAATPGSSSLDGLFDRTGFEPTPD